MADAFPQIERAARHSAPPLYSDLSEAERKQVSSSQPEAPYRPMAQEVLEVADKGIAGHAQFHMPAPEDPLAPSNPPFEHAPDA